MSALLKRLDAPNLRSGWRSLRRAESPSTRCLRGSPRCAATSTRSISTDNALGRVKMSALVFGSMIKARLEIAGRAQRFLPRSQSLRAESPTCSAPAALGIDAVVALAGDKLAADRRRRASGPRPRRVRPACDDRPNCNRGDTGEGQAAAQDAAAVRDRRGRQSQSQSHRARVRTARAQGRRRARDS